MRGPSSGPLFCYTDGRPLTRQLLSSTVKSIVRLAGLPGNYSGHSFRIGAATTAASQGVPDHLIKTLGRWSNDAYQRYIRTSADSHPGFWPASIAGMGFYIGGCGLWATSPHHPGLGQPGGPSAGRAGLVAPGGYSKYT